MLSEIILLYKLKKTFPQNGCYIPPNFHVDFEISLILIRYSFLSSGMIVFIYIANHCREIHVSDDWLVGDPMLKQVISCPYFSFSK